MTELDPAYRARLRATLHDLASARPARRKTGGPVAFSLAALAVAAVAVAAVVVLVPRAADVRVVCVTSAAPVAGQYVGVDIPVAAEGSEGEGSEGEGAVTACEQLWAEGVLVAPVEQQSGGDGDQGDAPLAVDPQGGALNEPKPESVPGAAGQSGGPQSGDARVLSRCEVDASLVVVVPGPQSACSTFDPALLATEPAEENR